MCISGSRILYVVNVDESFLSHRLPLAQVARELGAEVVVAGGDTGKSDVIRELGVVARAIWQ